METNQLRKNTALWILIILILFISSIVLGIIMRLNQGAFIDIAADKFYGDMTVHGLTMIGIWYVAGMAAVNFIMERYVKTSRLANTLAMIFTIVGVVMLWTSVFVGNFHAGWTFLYPLPLRPLWETWVTVLFLASLTVLGVGWLIWTLSLIIALLKKYSIAQVFAWQHFRKEEPKVETPPFVLISMISLLGVLTCLIVAVILLVLLYLELFSNGAIVNDSLLMKNLTYFFGHTLANEMLYLGLAVLYELFGEISGRPKWKTTWYIALAWNLTLFFVLGAFFHHMYMDFVQPQGLQIAGQIFSYLASIPSAGVTIFSILVAVYGNKVKWSLSNTLFFIGTCGWVVGGVGAVIDATIVNNVVLHNTLWVPAHFHTYNAMGNVLFSLAFFYWFSVQYKNDTATNKISKPLLTLLIIGGVLFLAAFYIGGADSIPRRYSTYPDELSAGKSYALLGAAGASIYLLGILWFFFSIFKKCLNIVSSRS